MDDEQLFTVASSAFTASSPDLMAQLEQAYARGERPRCLCVAGGVEMYIARHRDYVLKRMPGTGHRHSPACPSFEPEPGQSGLGELLGEAVIEHAPDAVELRVSFALARGLGRSVAGREAREPVEVKVPRKRMSLRALMHYLFERAGFNRWTPAMTGRRNQGVVCKYLGEAARQVRVKGLPLSDRLYVPEPFSQSTHALVAERRRLKLSLLHSAADDDMGQRMAVLMGEYKCSEVTPLGCKIWIKHMPDVPLLVATKTWSRIQQAFSPVFEARDADTPCACRLVICALIYARREHTYQVEAASLMLTSADWIPLEGVHELPLLNALVSQQRRFIKPLRYDAGKAVTYASALLVDAGEQAVPLYVQSAVRGPETAVLKKACPSSASESWVWRTDAPLPTLPSVVRPSR